MTDQEYLSSRQGAMGSSKSGRTIHWISAKHMQRMTNYEYLSSHQVITSQSDTSGKIQATRDKITMPFSTNRFF